MTVKQQLLGNIDPQLYIASLIAALVGVLFVLLLGSTLRSVDSPHSPRDFSWSYLLSDNAKRIYLNILVVIVTLRFMPEIMESELSVWKGFIVGTASDGLALLIKQKTNILNLKKENNEQ
jgi:uncharacterized membrane-anchored protein